MNAERQEWDDYTSYSDDFDAYLEEDAVTESEAAGLAQQEGIEKEACGSQA